MPRKYIRTGSVTRGDWTENNLQDAVEAVVSGKLSKRGAEKLYNVPARTISRRILSGSFKKVGLGPQASLGVDNERRLAAYIKRLGAAGFAPDRDCIRSLAYDFAENLKLPHRFSHENKKAGYHWLQSFLERNKDIAIRQAEGLSMARAQGMNRKEVADFFNLLEKVMLENDLMNSAENIFNVDESGIQLINKPGKVLAQKGAKDVHVITPKEKGETVSLVACCNAAGYFMPPVLIMKGVNKKAEFSDGLPHGSQVYMSKKSAYMTSDLFLKWFKEHFLPRKAPNGKTILILDGHSSHSNSIELLDLAYENGVIIICLPSHTTQALQPLDRSFFKPLKTYYNKEANSWILKNKTRNITRYQVGSLLGAAWGKAASTGIGSSGFKACGIFPLNPNIIPDHFFAISDQSEPLPPPTVQSLTATQSEPSTSFQGPSAFRSETPSPSTVSSIINSLETPKKTQEASISFVENMKISHETSEENTENTNLILETPTKILEGVLPLPVLPTSTVKRKQTACVLTSPENITFKKTKNASLIKKSKKNIRDKVKEKDKREKIDIQEEKTNLQKEKNVKLSAQGPIGDDSNICAECAENYFKTKKKSDWIKCLDCQKWLHETCTLYKNLCNVCGREKIRKINLHKQE